MSDINNRMNVALDKMLNTEFAIETTSSRPNRGLIPTSPPEEKTMALVGFEPKELEISAINDEQDVSDKELARASIRNVLLETNATLSALLHLAKATEHPKAFEVAAQFAKTIVDAAERLDDLVEGKQQKSRSKSTKGTMTGDGQTITTQNNQTIIASTEEVVRMIREARKQNEVIDL